jgi:para-nitrobenzyl esterase
MALRWVQANIAAFGGNPDTITLGGQSAGANCTGRMMLDPDVRPSVRRVLLQSGGFGREPSTAADMEPTARVFIQALGIDRSPACYGPRRRPTSSA